jgi:hypothetical protein
MKPRQYIACLFVAVFVIYPLSLGPAMRVHHIYGKNQLWPLMDALYRSLDWAVGQRHPFDFVLAWYVNQWLPIDPEDRVYRE